MGYGTVIVGGGRSNRGQGEIDLPYGTKRRHVAHEEDEKGGSPFKIRKLCEGPSQRLSNTIIVGAVGSGEVAESPKMLRYRQRIEEKVATCPGLAKYAHMIDTTPIKHKGPAMMGQVGGYGSLKTRAQVGDGTEHDHIPSIAAISMTYKAKLGRALTAAEYKLLHDRATAIEIPDYVHALSRTYKARNAPTQIANDSVDLYAAACKDIAYLRANLQNANIADEQIQYFANLVHLRNTLLGIYSLPDQEQEALLIFADQVAAEATSISSVSFTIEATKAQDSQEIRLGQSMPFPSLEEISTTQSIALERVYTYTMDVDIAPLCAEGESLIVNNLALLSDEQMLRV